MGDEFPEKYVDIINSSAQALTILLYAHEDPGIHVGIIVTALAQCMARPDVQEFYKTDRRFHRAVSHMLADILKVDRMGEED